MWDVNFTLIADGLNGVWRWALTMWDVNKEIREPELKQIEVEH